MHLKKFGVIRKAIEVKMEGGGWSKKKKRKSWHTFKTWVKNELILRVFQSKNVVPLYVFIVNHDDKAGYVNDRYGLFVLYQKTQKQNSRPVIFCECKPHWQFFYLFWTFIYTIIRNVARAPPWCHLLSQKIKNCIFDFNSSRMLFYSENSNTMVTTQRHNSCMQAKYKIK